MSLRPARAQIREQSEPLVDVLDEEEEVVVVAELSGVEKEDISLYASKDGLTISVDTPQRKHQKELPLPEEVDPKPVKASYKNGVLAILFKKKSKGEKIRIQQLNRARKNACPLAFRSHDFSLYDSP